MKHLFIVAHPDDEILGSCGTIASLVAKGEGVSVAIMSYRSATREKGLIEVTKKNHKKLGISKTYFGDFEMMKFSEYSRYDFTRFVEDLIKKERPDYIYTHDINDIHNDHRVLSQIVIEASKLPFRGTGYNKNIKGIYFMEIPTSTDWGSGFIPNAFYEVSEERFALQEELLKEYDGVIREVPHPRNGESLKALARYRGCQCGVKYAEAYRKVFELTEV